MSLSVYFPTMPMRTASEVSLRQSSREFGQLSKTAGQLSKDGDARDRLCAFLRRRHPHKTAEAVEAATHGVVSAASVRKWFERASGPGFDSFVALVPVYGAELLVAVVGDAPESLLAAAIAERRARYLRRLAALESEFGIGD